MMGLYACQWCFAFHSLIPNLLGIIMCRSHFGLKKSFCPVILSALICAAVFSNCSLNSRLLARHSLGQGIWASLFVHDKKKVWHHGAHILVQLDRYRTTTNTWACVIISGATKKNKAVWREREVVLFKAGWVGRASLMSFDRSRDANEARVWGEKGMFGEEIQVEC